MSDDEIEIDHGGAIAVDTDVLRDVVGRLRMVAGQVDAAESAAHRARTAIVSGPGLSAAVDLVSLHATAERIGALSARMSETAVGIGLMADAFELVELRAQREAQGAADTAASLQLDARIAELIAKDPRLADMAAYLEEGWKHERYQGLSSQFDPLDVLGLNGGAVMSAIMLMGASGLFGKVQSWQTLQGTADPVSVRPVATSTPIAPPASLADAFRRFPEADGAQVKVEKYTFADGSTRFVVYAKGTQSGWFGGGNPWDMKSNVELYSNQAAASYQATIEALHQAGAGPGDVVDVFAHSQAGMIVSHLAMESEFEVPLVVTAGSPVEPTLSDDQLLVQLRHTDDPVNGLAGGGSSEGTGSPESFVAHRQGDPMPGPQDLLLEPHLLEQYIETAEMVDDSGDPRIEAYRELLAELGDAEYIESTEYEADRTGWAG